MRFKQLLDSGGTDIEYRLGAIREKYDLETSDGKVAYLREAVEQVLCKIASPVEQDVYASKVAQETDVDKGKILATAAGIRARKSGREEKKRIREQQEVRAAKTAANPEKQKHLRAALAEEHVLAFLFQNQERAGELERLLPPEKFVTA